MWTRHIGPRKETKYQVISSLNSFSRIHLTQLLVHVRLQEIRTSRRIDTLSVNKKSNRGSGISSGQLEVGCKGRGRHVEVLRRFIWGLRPPSPLQPNLPIYLSENLRTRKRSLSNVRPFYTSNIQLTFLIHLVQYEIIFRQIVATRCHVSLFVWQKPIPKQI